MSVDLDNLEALDKAATAGPWKTEHQRADSIGNLAAAMAVSIAKGGRDWHWLETQPYSGTWPAITGNGEKSEANAALIAAMRNALPELLRAARKAATMTSAEGVISSLKATLESRRREIVELRVCLAEVERERDAFAAEKAMLTRRLKSYSQGTTRGELLDGTPPGTEIAYYCDGVFTRLGVPDSEDHNCDAMGCGQNHVIQRVKVAAIESSADDARTCADGIVRRFISADAFEAACRVLAGIGGK